MAKKERDRLHDRQIVAEDGESGGIEPLPQPGEDWLSGCITPDDHAKAKQRVTIAM